MKNIKKYRNFILMLVDCLIVYISYALANYTRYDYGAFLSKMKEFNKSFIIILGIYLAFFVVFRLYKSLWEHASVEEFMYAIGGCSLSAIMIEFVNTILSWNISLSIMILANMFIFFLVFALRISFRVYRRMINKFSTSTDGCKRTMIIGAGSAGATMIKEMKLKKGSKYEAIC